ncbi:hypothetical protein PC41400_14700 [Paenibacillus chitinolyticus]|uniref:Uncharacterized protein n=1 Tax=Paenibacillus chitinolyticus TaxID=79263 RepID=A0A410WWM8_9BACL|nr:hypothetical protein [Paenibacillus chitinolyticus]MCY9593979.1 hypothetical protein [Paenibacillus chitinolyticus]MCY9599634.1 hypothetical protein [Paenibacillus chitinolyticus]QAV18859.1 hypothetical protein PC41400_14700 [Paenibacillus chitinolyticus]
MQTPSIFQLGKLSNLLDEINKGTGSVWSFVSCGSDSAMTVSLTFPNLTSDLESINNSKNKITEYFGLDESDKRVSISSGYGKTELSIILESQQIIIKVTNK